MQPHPILASLEASGSTSLTSFLHELYAQLAKFAKQAIDTPAERLAIVEAVGTYFDKYVSPTLPAPMRAPFRESLVGIVDSTLSTLAAL